MEKILNNKTGKYIEMISTFLSFFSSLIYVVGDYTPEKVEWFDQIDWGILSFYLFEYLLKYNQ